MTFVLFRAIILAMKDIKAIKQSVKELFELQERLRYPIRELAEMLHVNTRTIRRWKDKESLPHSVYVPMINKLLEVEKKGKP